MVWVGHIGMLLQGIKTLGSPKTLEQAAVLALASRLPLPPRRCQVGLQVWQRLSREPPHLVPVAPSPHPHPRGEIPGQLASDSLASVHANSLEAAVIRRGERGRDRAGKQAPREKPSPACPRANYFKRIRFALVKLKTISFSVIKQIIAHQKLWAPHSLREFLLLPYRAEDVRADVEKSGKQAGYERGFWEPPAWRLGEGCGLHSGVQKSQCHPPPPVFLLLH